MVRQVRHIYEFGPFRLIPEERQLLRDDQPVPLTDKPFDLLLALVANSGRLIKKGELMEMVWPDASVEEANLSVNMTAVRRALGEGPNDHQYVETVPRSGYRFVAGVRERWDERTEPPGREPVGEEAVASPSDAVERQTPDTSSSTVPRVSTRRWPVVLVGTLLLSSLFIGLSVGGLRGRLLGEGEPVRVRSLAVLPLENLSGDASQDYFADGMTEALITDLAKLGELRVMSRSSVTKYKGARPSLPEVGRALNVDALLTGSVVRSGERVRIAVQLVHAATDRNLWADSYERDLRDVLALQREVARDVAGGVRIKLTPQAQARIGGARPVNPEAYDQYLRGKYYLYRQNRENNEAAIVSLERAVAADPTFAAAQAELAQAYVWKLFLFTPNEERLAEKAFVAAEKALASDPDSAVAYLARGRLLWTPANRFPHEKAILEYRRALALDPTLDEARNQLALVYNHIGAFDEALRELRMAVEQNPGNHLAQFRIGETFLFQGKYEEALGLLRGVPEEANPALVGHQIVWALFNLGRKEEAAAALDQFLKDYPEDNRGLYTSLQAVLAASAGQEREAEDKIKSAIERGKGYGHFHHTAYHIACAYARMNKPEQALKWLEVAAQDGFPCYPLFEKDTNLDGLRRDARFASFMAKLRQQWESYKSILGTTPR